MRGLFAVGVGIALGVTIAIILAAREDAPSGAPIPAAATPAAGGGA